MNESRIYHKAGPTITFNISLLAFTITVFHRIESYGIGHTGANSLSDIMGSMTADKLRF